MTLGIMKPSEMNANTLGPDFSLISNFEGPGLRVINSVDPGPGF